MLTKSLKGSASGKSRFKISHSTAWGEHAPSHNYHRLLSVGFTAQSVRMVKSRDPTKDLLWQIERQSADNLLMIHFI